MPLALPHMAVLTDQFDQNHKKMIEVAPRQILRFLFLEI